MPDTIGNRKVVVVMLRYLVDADGNPLFTLQELCTVLESDKRQTASKHVEDFRECGEEFTALLMQQRKVDKQVVEAVRQSLEVEPLSTLEELAHQANVRLDRQDITMNNVCAALDQISCKELRMIFKKQLDQGECHYCEEYVIKRLFEIASSDEDGNPKQPTMNTAMIDAVQQATAPRGTYPQTESMPGAETKALLSVNMNEQELAGVWDTPMAWKLWALLLYLQGASTAAIGGWLGVHKSTLAG